VSATQQVLAKLKLAKSVAEGDDISDELAQAARQNPDEVIELYYAGNENPFALVWCLQGLTDPRIIELYQHALRHKDHTVRWAAIEGLKYSANPALIPLFIAALKDQSHLVKMVAVDWLKRHGDANAVAPLEHLFSLPSLIKTSPGLINNAKEAACILREKSS
jgi:HEAT repeat protein